MGIFQQSCGAAELTLYRVSGPVARRLPEAVAPPPHATALPPHATEPEVS